MKVDVAFELKLKVLTLTVLRGKSRCHRQLDRGSLLARLMNVSLEKLP
jgi:hypothetical protein